MKETKEEERRYTYEEVKAILCEGCLFGLSVVKDIGNPIWYHTINGQRVECKASDWKNRTAVELIVDDLARCPDYEGKAE